MKKSTLLFFLLTCLSSSYSQETLFLETCGSVNVSSSKKIETYTGWDNSAPVTFSTSTTLDGSADVRAASYTNHVWFPYDKASDLIISNINTANYTGLKLSFDIAAYKKLTDANVNKLMIYANETQLTVPSMTFTDSKFISIQDIAISNSKAITLKFEYTAENNTNGYRLDNIRITGEKSMSDVSYPIANELHPFISGNSLRLPTLADGTIVEIFDLLGTNIQLSALRGGSIELSNKIKKYLYLVRVNNVTLKILL